MRRHSFSAALGLLCLLPTLAQPAPPHNTASQAATAGLRPREPIPPDLRFGPLTPVDRSYLAAVRANSDDLTDDLSEYARLTAKPRLNDKDWIRRMSVVLSTLHVLVRQGRLIRPPFRYSRAQSTYLAALSQYDRVSQVIPGAIGRRDRAAIARCGGYLAAAARDTRLAAAQIKAESR